MRELNPILYDQIEEWCEELSPDVDVFTLAHTIDSLHHSKEAIVACLAEEFPISYRQSYEVYQDLFHQSEIYQAYDQQQIINVLALGTGSGGDVFGLIHAIEESFSNKVINIFTVDGNRLALRSQMNIFRHYISLQVVKNEVNLIPIATIVQPSFKGFKEKLDQFCFKPYGFKKFDLIQSFNWVNETAIQKQVSFYELYQFIQTMLHLNRVAIIAEAVNPSLEEMDVSRRALNEFMLFCSRLKKNHQPICALTPTPCVARRFAGLNKTQCVGCKGCFDEIKCYVKRQNQTRYAWESSYLFVMKMASGSLGNQLGKKLQNETIGYQTSSDVGLYLKRNCTLNKKVEATTLGNAFNLSLNDTK